MEPISNQQVIQKPRIVGWKMGAKIGFIIGAILGVMLTVFLFNRADPSDLDSNLLVQSLLPITNLALVFLCIGSLIGRLFSRDNMPYRLKAASVTTIIPVAFLLITGFQPNIGMGFLIVLVYLLFAPIPLFVGGFIIGWIIDRVILNKHKKNHPELYMNKVQIMSGSSEVSGNFIKRFFDYFLKP